MNRNAQHFINFPHLSSAHIAMKLMDLYDAHGESLPYWFQKTASDLADGPHEETLAFLYNPGILKLDQLIEHPNLPYDMRKPRITLKVIRPSEANLAVIWEPTNWAVGDCDFAYYPRAHSRSRLSGPPNDELIYIRDFGHFFDCIREGLRTWGNLADAAVYATSRLIDELVDRLEHRFIVTLETGLFVDYDRNHEAKTSPFVTNAEIIYTELRRARMATEAANAAAKQRRDVFENFADNFGFSLDQLVQTQRAVGTKTPTGREMKPKQYPLHICNHLKTMGINVPLAVVVHAVAIAEEFSNDFTNPFTNEQRAP